MKSVMDFLRGKKKPEDTPTTEDSTVSQETVEANPTNVKVRMKQIKDVTNSRKKMLEELDN